MNIQTLVQIIKDKFTAPDGKSLAIPASGAQSLLQSADIAGLITTYLSGTLTISDLQPPTVTAATATYDGTVAFLGQSFPAAGIFYLVNSSSDGTPELTLALTLPAGWAFSQTYPKLKDQIVDQLSYNKPMFVLESYQNDGSGTFPNLKQGFNFSGTPKSSDSPLLSPVNWLLGANLLLTGTLENWNDPANTAPTMTLATPSEATSLTLGTVVLSTWIEAESGYTVTNGNSTLVTSVDLKGSIAIGSGAQKLLTLTMELQNDPDLLTFSLDANAALDSLAELSGLVSGNSLANMIPAQYPLSQILHLDELSIVVAPALRVIVNVSFGIRLLSSQPSVAEAVALEPHRIGYFSPLVGPPRVIAAADSDSALALDSAPKSPTWVIVPKFVSISDIFLRFLVIDPLHPSLKNVYATIGATFWIGELYPIAAQITLPDVTVSAFLLPGNTIPLADVMKQFGVTPPDGFVLDVTRLEMMANPSYKTFDLGLTLDGTVNLFSFNDGKFNLTINSITVDLSLSQVGFSGKFVAYSNFAQTVDFLISAQKPSGASSTWIFAAQITHPFSIGQLIENVTGWTPPDFVMTMNVTEFGLTYNTGDKTFSLNAGLQWLLPALNLEIDLLFQLQSSNGTASMVLLPPNSLASTSSTSTSLTTGNLATQALYSGSLQGDFKFMGLTLTLIYAFDQVKKEKTYTLRVGPIIAVFSDPEKGDKVLQFNFGNTTLGDILVFLIKLADPSASNQLSAPWSALNAINLANLSIIINFTQKFFEITYKTNINLGFLSVDSIGLRYTRNYGQGQVKFLIQGALLGQPFGKDDPLTWDAVNGQPPALPGAGSKLLDLQYVGVGQHVSINVRGLTSISAVIDALEKTVVPLTNTSKNPLEQVGGLQFNSGSNWLLGTKFVILGTFGLSIVFMDPEVYGLRIDVSGSKGGIFNGLSFEILYRKVTDSIGVYHIELKLPDVMRHLEFGEVSITLPIVVLDIYTNGNFRIDFGFPISLQDFSNSFAIQVFPFVGYGGFYFAVLNGATSSRVPVIDNGNFNPVIEVGFALSIGVGKTLSMGPLSAGISVTVIGMIQGAFAWFHPTDESGVAGFFYWIQGTVALVGKVYGTVDFVVIKASVSLTVFASITLTVEAYKPIIIYMQAGVEVEVSLKILFITIHFSFSATITLTFTIGSASLPPWHEVTKAPSTLRMRNQLSLYSAAPALAAKAFPHQRAGLRFPNVKTFSFTAVPTSPQDAITVKVRLTPVISQALPTDFLPAASGNPPLASCNLLLFAENAIEPASANARQASVPVADAGATAFNMLAQKLVTWAIQFIGKDSDATVTLLELEQIHEQLTDPKIVAQTFSYTNLTGFFKNYNVSFEIDLRPTKQSDEISASFFPMFPELTLKVGSESVPFWSTNPVDSNYVIGLSTYFEQLMVEYENNAEKDPQQTGATARQPKTLMVDDDSPTSMAGYLFCAYFALLTRALIQNAKDYLKSYTYTVTDAANTSLAIIAGQFPGVQAEYIARQGDTMASVATQLAMPLHFVTNANAHIAAQAPLNAGTRLAVSVGVTAESIVTANQSTTGLFGTTPLQLSNIVYQVKSSDTFTSIASALSFPGTAPLDPFAIISANADNAAIVQPGTSFPLPKLTYTGRDGDTLDNVALYFGVPASDVTQDGMQFTISNVTHKIQAGFVIDYAWKSGDTLDSVIQYFFGPLSGDQLTDYETLLSNWNLTVVFNPPPAPGVGIKIPYAETLTNIARYYFPNVPAAQQLQTLAPSVVSQQILAPLSTLAIASLSYAPQAQDTFNGIAQKFNLKLDDLTNQIASQTNLFPNNTKITVPNVPAIKVSDLVVALGSSPQTNSTAASTSRFLLQGLRLPYPTMSSSTYPLYSLTAQSFPLPTPLPAISLGIANSVPWIQFAGGGKSIDLAFTAEEQAQITAFGSLKLAPQISWLGRLPLFDYQPLHFTVQNPLHWQAAQLPPVPCLSASQPVSEPTVWALPSTLMQRIASASDAALLYSLQVSTYIDSTSGMQTNPVKCYAWATTINVEVRTIAGVGAEGATMPKSYLLIGADDVGKQTLFDLLTYLQTAAGQKDSAQLLLLYTPDPSGPNPKGLASDKLTTAQTFLLQTNLSTESSSGAPMAWAARGELLAQHTAALRAQSGKQVFAATIDESTNFLSLVWEASVVRSGGYYLNYSSSTQNGLPGYLFSQGREATITLMVLLNSQTQAGSAPLMPFNNVVVVGDNIDASSSDVYASPLTYKVQPGDTLQTIAKALTSYRMSAPALALANQTIQNLLKPGQTLNISSNTPYTIQYGDTFATIAQAHAPASVTDIAAASAALDMFTPLALMQLSGAQTYVVQQNDSLQGIVQKLNVPGLDVPTLAEANQWNLAFLKPTALLNLTATTTYTIQPGDTLASIAMDHPPASVRSIAVASQGLSILSEKALAFYGSSQLEMQAATPAGCTAFQLRRSYLAGDPNQQQLNLLFNLLGFSVAQNAYFNVSNEGLPVGPQKEPGLATDNPQAKSDGVFYYKQVLAFSKRANPASNPVPNTPALPAPSAFPYAGIFTPAGQTQNAVIQPALDFHDLSGSLTVANPAPAIQAIPVGYTDDLIGLPQWHSVNATFDFPSGQPQLEINASFSPNQYLPDFGQSYENSHQSALAHYESFTELYYQLQEPGLEQFALTTSLGSVDSSLVARQLVQLSLLGFVEQIYGFLDAAKDLLQVFPPIAAGTLLGDVANTYATSVAAIMTANKSVELVGQWFAENAALNIPNYYIVKSGDTVTMILKNVTTAQLEQNDQVPLNAGTSLSIPQQAYEVDAKSRYSLIQIANLLYSTVVDLATQNPTVPLTTSQLTFTLGGITLPVTSSDSLQTMAEKFNAQSSELDASPGTVAVANQTVEGVFAGQSLHYTAYVVQKKNTLATVAALFKTTAGNLISLNLQTADVFPAGSALYLFGADTNYLLQAGDTFSIVTSSYNISIDELGARNAGASLLAMNQSADKQFLAIPDAVQLPSAPKTPYYSSYLAKGGGETIGDIIGKYAGWNIAGVVALNQYLPGLFASHELPGTNVTPKLTDTIVTLAQTLNITPQAFVQQFQGQADILRPRALLLCPPLQTSAGATLTTMAQIYNLASPLAVAQANSALLRLLQTPQTLSYTYTAPDGTAIQKDYSIGANNTLATVVAQFNLLFSGLTTLTLDDMVDQNPAIVLAPNQIILAPPSPAMLPPLAVTLLDGYPDPIFPLTVNLQMLRNQQWVDPDFKNDTSVFFNSASVTASPLAAGAAPLSLSQFATNFENAFGGFKLGTGEAEGEGASSKPRLWVVNLDSKRGGIKFSADASKVKFFALEPLWNQLWRADKVTIPTYTSGQALEFDQVQDFQNVDLDSWLSTLLGAVDLVLSPQYSVPAFGLSTLAQSLLSEILEAKEDLAKGLRGLVNSLLSGATGDLDDAQEALYQQALTALSSVYSTNVIVQFPFTVTSTYTNASTAPLLSGKAVIKPYVSDGTVTNSTLVSHQLAAGDTFVSIANRFGITVIELVTANKDVANVFQPASSVTVLVNGKPVAVTADNGDTLSKITEKIYGGAADLEQLAVALWTVDLTGGKGDCGYTLCTTPPLGEQPTVLEYLELLPVASFSTAKLPLSQGESAVTFLLAVKNPEQRRMAFFDLDYAVNKLEYNVQLPPVPMASGVASNYAESSWLTFINPLDAVNFGQLQVPIPLRAFPSLPVLSQQSAVPSDPGSSDLVKAKQWNYEFVLNNQVAAQDSMELGAFFNITGSQAPVPPIQQGPSKKANQGLYQALAQFMAVQAAVMSDLTLLTSDPADSAVIAALQALHDLVKNVTTAWFAPAPAFKGAQEEPGESHWYALDTIINEQVDNQFQYLMLTNDLGNPLWPKINGNQYALQIGDEALYDYTEPISSPLDLRFAIDDLDAIQRQNGWSGALVVRNQNLLGVATVQTNPDFVYQTLLTLFSNKITPYLLIDAYAPLSPGAGNDPVSQLARALAAFFTVLFNLDTDPPKNSFQIRAQARYAFSLVTATAEVARHPGLGMVDEKSIMTSIPLVLNPLATFDPAKDADPTKPTSFVSQFATATISGAQGAGVAGSNGGTLVPGVYLFDFSVYSSLPTGTGTTALSKPILDIRNRYWEGPQ